MGISKVSLDGVTQIDITSSTVTPSHLYVNSTAVDAEGNNIEGGAQADNEDAFLERRMSGVYYNDTITRVGEYGLHRISGITKLVLPNVSTISTEACYYMTDLEEVDVPNLQSISPIVFYGCTKLKKVNGIENVTALPRHIFYGCTALESISLPNCTSVNSYAFYGCTALQTVNLENCYALGSYIFYNCTSLKNINVPKARDFSNNGTTAADQFFGCTALETIHLPSLIYDAGAVRAFKGCTSLKTIDLPNCIGFFGNEIFMNCTSLEYIVLPNFGGHKGQESSYKIATSYFSGDKNLKGADIRDTPAIMATAFNNCTALSALILRGDRVATLENISAFTGSPFASGKSGGTLYVPAAQITAYQAASNWATILGYSTNSITSIEGSQYENYYVDGTAKSTDTWDRAFTEEFRVTSNVSFTWNPPTITFAPIGLSWGYHATTYNIFYTWGEIKTGYKVRVSFDYEITGINGTNASFSIIPCLFDTKLPTNSTTRIAYDGIAGLTSNGSGHYEGVQDPIQMRNVDGTISDSNYYGLRFYAYTGNKSRVVIKNVMFEVSPTDTVLEEEE